MTSTTDTAEHPEVTEISDLAEGLLPPTRTTDVQQHLDGCPLCADVLATLEEIRGTLGTVSDPPRMPEEIASRIDAALAFESDRETGPVSRETSTAADRSADRPADRPAGHAHGATGPGRKARSSRRRTGAVLGAVLTVTAIGVGALLIQNDGGGSPVARKSSGASTFAKDSLETKVTTLLGSSTFGTEGNGPSTQGTKAPMQKGAVSVPPCIQLGTHRNEDPLAAETGTYEGKKAYLVVLPHKTDPAHRVTAFVVDSSCVGSSSGSAGTLLYKHDYDHGSGAPKSTR
ncbi:anti-sigma factor family protein [Streptomyces sp. NPDC051684]|uniref:anti-sigma factor family protein n=1 Tax=Streptomyces sp. NPDC051684 TaxID=3365670 RepID=UPI003796C846